MTSFDPYSQEYDQALNQGLSVSGEDKNYFARERISWLKKCLVELGCAPAPEHIMDFGCGIGTSIPFLLDLPWRPSVIGLDTSVKSLEVAKKSYLSNKVNYFLLEEYLAKADFDLVFSNGVFHHIPLNERSGAVKMIFQSLKPGGLFSLWENNPWNPGTRYVMSRIPFDKDAIPLNFLEAKKLLKESGFEILRTDFLFIMPGFLKALRFVEPFLRRAPMGAQYQVLARKM